jgi:N-carbamoyl-L-amino-acid hydrolase
MDVRRDALVGAARFAIRVRDTVTRDFPDCVGTVGSIEVDRAAVNVVPGHVRVRLELRAPEPGPLDSLEEVLLDLTRRDAEDTGLELEIARAGRWDPVELDPAMQSIVEAAANELGLSTRRLPSGAGHDAQELARVTRAGMIFVPSVGGISHDPAERTHWRDCVNGANVLLAAALSVARS